jgi:TPP-dependent pyruvate/acetoin dehydrogenase alpha subunit
MGDFTYRTREEVEAWKQRCPIARLRGVLRQLGVPEEDLAAIEADRAAAHLVEWLTDPASRRAIVARLDELAADVAHGGSADRAAAAVLAIAADDAVPTVSGRAIAGRNAA